MMEGGRENRLEAGGEEVMETSKTRDGMRVIAGVHHVKKHSY